MSKRAQNKEARRQQALQAARGLIARGGVDALSMRKLAAESSLAVNTLYALFDSREGVLGAIIADGIDRVGLQLGAYDPAKPLLAAEQLVRLSVMRIRDEAAFTKPMYRAIASFGPVGDVGRQRAAVLLTEVLHRAVKQRLLRRSVNVDILADHILRGFMSGALRWAHDVITLEELEADALYGLWVALCAAATSNARPAMVRRMARAQAQRGIV